MYGYSVFHEKIMKMLINNVHNNACSHAYIFDGMKGLHKHEAGLLFAQALTCLNPSAAPCGACSSCIEAKAKTNPDIRHIVRETVNGKPKKFLGIDPIRDAVADSQIKPFNSPKKVYIIDEGELMNAEAQNAFLKTLEEPPEYAVFIIVTDNAASLLPTVLSRSTLIYFQPVNYFETEKYLSEKYPDIKDNLSFYIKYCEGIPGEADRIIGDERFEGLRNECLNKLSLILSDNMIDAFEVQKFVSDNSDDAQTIFNLWLSFLRDIMVIKCQAFDNVVNGDKISEIRQMAAKYDMKLIAYAIDMTVKTQNMMSKSVKLSARALRYALFIKKTSK